MMQTKPKKYAIYVNEDELALLKRAIYFHMREYDGTSMEAKIRSEYDHVIGMLHAAEEIEQ